MRYNMIKLKQYISNYGNSKNNNSKIFEQK